MHSSRRQAILTFVAALGLTAASAGCASGGGEDGERAPRADPNLITAEELAPHANLSCREAIRQLRPRWFLRTDSPLVVQDGSHMSASLLDRIRASDVESLKYYSVADARVRYGQTVVNGAIEVTTRRR